MPLLKVKSPWNRIPARSFVIWRHQLTIDDEVTTSNYIEPNVSSDLSQSLRRRTGAPRFSDNWCAAAAHKRSRGDARRFLKRPCIDILVSLRDRALVAVVTYSFARVGTTVAMRVKGSDR